MDGDSKMTVKEYKHKWYLEQDMGYSRKFQFIDDPTPEDLKYIRLQRLLREFEEISDLSDQDCEEIEKGL